MWKPEDIKQVLLEATELKRTNSIHYKCEKEVGMYITSVH